MKTGFVGILGRPNVGKSTLLNLLLNKKISIVTNKSQTTRNNIKGILSTESYQIIFVDTPGIHKPKVALSKEMNSMAFSTAHDVDVSVLVVDANKKYGNGDKYLLSHLDIKQEKTIILLNKIDLCRIDEVKKLKDYYKSLFPKSIILESSLIENFGVNDLLNTILLLLPEGPNYYEKNYFSDKDDVFFIKELIREQILKTLKQEVPHCIAIYIDDINYDKNPIDITASIIVEKDSQKGIVIGENGKKIKEIGIKARKSIESFLNKHIYLNLQVKIDKEWRNNRKSLEKFGYVFKK